MALRKALLTTVGVIGLAASAHASIIANFAGVTAGPTPGTYLFNYNATLAANEQIVNGSFVTLIDFGPVIGTDPYSSTGLLASNFVFSQALTGPAVTNVTPPDDPNILNVTATYDGGAGIVTGVSLSNGAAGNLGTFSLETSIGNATSSGNQESSAQHFDPVGGTTGQPDGNTTGSTVPSASPIPEPASIALIGSALIGLGVVRRRKNG